MVWGDDATECKNKEGSTLGNDELDTPGYKLMAGDVRDANINIDKLKRANVDGSLPTIIITECILIYMKAEESSGIL